MKLVAVAAISLISVLVPPYSVGYHFQNGRCLLLIVFKWGGHCCQMVLEGIGPEKAISQWVSCNDLGKAVFLLLCEGVFSLVTFLM